MIHRDSTFAANKSFCTIKTLKVCLLLAYKTGSKQTPHRSLPIHRSTDHFQRLCHGHLQIPHRKCRQLDHKDIISTLFHSVHMTQPHILQQQSHAFRRFYRFHLHALKLKIGRIIVSILTVSPILAIISEAGL